MSHYHVASHLNSNSPLLSPVEVVDTRRQNIKQIDNYLIRVSLILVTTMLCKAWILQGGDVLFI